jgi:uncharacterized circularly permuted ATP-grasp superfamily protein/uncharacterized alpha-E superfamily protein
MTCKRGTGSMSDIRPDDPVASRSEAASLFDGRSFAGDGYCEAFGADSTLRDHWQPLTAALDGLGPEVLNKLQDRARRMRHEDGATYNPFDDPTGKGIPWALEIIPQPITAAEWKIIEDGLIQRAHLLEQIVKDSYGLQNLLKEGHLAPELIYANPHFLRPCHGIRPAGNRFLTFYAADLYRAADGRFRVLRDYGANPAGIGYALENRIVQSRVFSELYHKTQVRRLAPFFQIFQQGMIQRASLRREDPNIVLLSPGPDSRIYFEHALLSRYLGYPLVEAQDLTVRNGRVFLKKLAGLEPVESIFRHIADDQSDPFLSRQQTAAGVAGLIQTSRDRTIDITNPIGSGFVDTPALQAFLPALCRQLMGAELILENHPMWWCGTAEGREHILSNIEQFDVGPAMDRHLSVTPPPEGLRAAIQAAPFNFVAQERVCPSTVPAWQGEGVSSRCMLMRVFACANDHGFAVMPGGLAITAPDAGTLLGNCFEMQPSKDIWVLSERPVEPFSLMASLKTVTTVRRSSDLPSRVADHLLWLGRYSERAEGLVRILRSVFRRLSGESRVGDMPEFPFLLKLLRARNAIPNAVDIDNPIPRYRELSVHLNDALLQQDRPESVFAILKQVREAARNVRDRLSLDSWRVINRLEGFADAPSSDPLDLLDDILLTLSSLSGLAMESMTRGLGWRFMDMGRRVERAINQTGLIRIGLPQICGGSPSALEALLEVADTIMTYRARYRMTFQLEPVLDLLILDESNPKSLAFQCSQLAQHVEHLPGQSDRRFVIPEDRIALEMLTAVRLLDLTAVGCEEADPPTEPLAAFLDSIEERLKNFGQQISAHYLSRIPATPHFSHISHDPKV